jgi:hypothetical protein
VPAARARRRRALYISSPIGLAHAQRDVAIAAEIGHAVDYRPVETDGATRAASLIAELV